MAIFQHKSVNLTIFYALCVKILLVICVVCWKIYAVFKNFTQPLVAPVVTNIMSETLCIIADALWWYIVVVHTMHWWWVGGVQCVEPRLYYTSVISRRIRGLVVRCCAEDPTLCVVKHKKNNKQCKQHLTKPSARSSSCCITSRKFLYHHHPAWSVIEPSMGSGPSAPEIFTVSATLVLGLGPRS